MEPEYQYYAFVSYRSSDEKWAKWVQQQIEAYKLPAVLQKKNPQAPKTRIRPLFRYHTDIQPNELKEELRSKLEQSKYLLVICSPRSAQSQWVGQEIENFVLMGRRDRIIPIIVDGRPYSGDPATECFHPVIHKYFPHSDNIEEDHEILGVNLNEEGSGSKRMKRQRAIMQVISRMLDVNYDQLWNRRRRQIIRQTVFSILSVILVIGLIIATWLLNRPQDVQVTLVPAGVQNANLPEAYEAEVILHLEQEDVPIVLTHDNPAGTFYDIPARLMGKPARVTMTCRDYLALDTMLTLTREIQLPLERDAEVYGRIDATVFSITREMPLAGVKLTIGGYTVTTDPDGHFELFIPLAEQRKAYHVTSSVALEVDTIYTPCGKNNVLLAN